MDQDMYEISAKEMNDYEDQFDNDDVDDYSDDYDEEEGYMYTDILQQDRATRRGNSFSYSGSGNSLDINEDSRKDHHNKLERKRRASIKSCYAELREAIPSLRDNKASRSVILQRAADYLEELCRRDNDHVACVDHFSSENLALEEKCRDIENEMRKLSRPNGNAHNYSMNMKSRPSFRIRNEGEHDNLSGIGNGSNKSSTSTPALTNTCSTVITNHPSMNTSASVCFVASYADSSDDHKIISLKPDSMRSDQPIELGSNSSSNECSEHIEEAVAAKKSKME